MRVKRAMLRLDGRIHREVLPARMSMQVRDELVCEVPEVQTERLVGIIAEDMTAAAATWLCLQHGWNRG